MDEIDSDKNNISSNKQKRERERQRMCACERECFLLTEKTRHYSSPSDLREGHCDDEHQLTSANAQRFLVDL